MNPGSGTSTRPDAVETYFEDGAWRNRLLPAGRRIPGSYATPEAASAVGFSFAARRRLTHLTSTCTSECGA